MGKSATSGKQGQNFPVSYMLQYIAVYIVILSSIYNMSSRQQIWPTLTVEEEGDKEQDSDDSDGAESLQ